MSTAEYPEMTKHNSDASNLPSLLEHLAAALHKAMDSDPHLPPVLSVWTNGELTAVQPWLAGAPITALLAWEKQMAPAVDRRASVVFPPEDDAPGATNVTSTGTLYGIPVAVSVITHRNVRTIDADGRVTAMTLNELADDEYPITAQDVAVAVAAAEDRELEEDLVAAAG